MSLKFLGAFQIDLQRQGILAIFVALFIMAVFEVTDIVDARVAPFVSLTEAQLRNRLNESEGVFIVESPKVISVALDAGYEPISLLCERRHIDGDAAPIIARCPAAMPVYTGGRDLLAQLTGYKLTRGVLCAMRRPAPRSLGDVCAGARRVVVIDGVVDSTNVGAIFRSAAALGTDAVVVTGTSCDPLNRRAVRVSMGSVFLVPWAWADDDYQDELRRLGFKTAAMALTDRSVGIDDPCLRDEPRIAMIMGTEGDGLPQTTIDRADYTVKIPMSHAVDSLNVAAAAAVAMWELRVRR